MTARPITRRTAITSAAVVTAGFVLAPAARAAAPSSGGRPAPAGAGPVAAAAAAPRLTNLAHLDWLTERVAVPNTAAHTTYRLAEEPEIGVIWVYADSRPGNTFERVGGGSYRPETNTWGQGSYDADDITRAAVVYVREWLATGSAHAKEQAYQLLRGVAYFQTLTGPKAGQVVLWMQPDGTLNPSAEPIELPDPSDSDESYWTARTVWALGEGYAAFKKSDPAFAKFLAERMLLSVKAIHRDTLHKYGQYQSIHGVKIPDWLIVDGGDASSEAILGLAAYVQAGGPGNDLVRDALKKLSEGVAKLAAGTTTQWPHRALFPWALSQSDWHGWGANMPAALAAASKALGRKSLLDPAIADAAGFSAQLLTSTGPVNGLLPTPTDATQIAYGADARVQGLFRVGVAAGLPAVRALAGVQAGWFFGANPAGVAVYHPETGVTNDGVSGTGVVNMNSGAESTIHGLLAMQVLDANPDLARLAKAAASVQVRDGLTIVEAETATLSGDAAVVTPDPAWTGESLWGGQAISVGAGSTASWKLPASTQERLVQPVAELVHGSKARTTFYADGRTVGRLDFGDVGRQGNAPSPTMLLPVDLGHSVKAGAVTISAKTTGGTGRIDSLAVMPEVASLVASGNGGGVALLTSKSSRTEVRTVAVAGSGRTTVSVQDKNGRTRAVWRATSGSVKVPVLAGGFTLVTR